MALKRVVKTLDDVAAADRQHYGPGEGGAFTLLIEGAPGEPDEGAKVAEFRDRNVALLKQLARFDGIDPEAVKAERARLAELENAPARGRVAALEAELAQERTARAASEEAASRGRVRDSLRPKALAVGAIPAAVEMLLDKATPLFTLVNDAVQAQPSTFSRTRPGEPMTPEDWLADAVVEFPFLFHPSTGGGASASSPAPTHGTRELRDPSPQDLGRHADDIRSGALRVVYSS